MKLGCLCGGFYNLQLSLAWFCSYDTPVCENIKIDYKDLNGKPSIYRKWWLYLFEFPMLIVYCENWNTRKNPFIRYHMFFLKLSKINRYILRGNLRNVGIMKLLQMKKNIETDEFEFWCSCQWIRKNKSCIIHKTNVCSMKSSYHLPSSNQEGASSFSAGAPEAA